MVQKVETDYIGYQMMLPIMDRHAYDQLKHEVRVQASSTRDADCFEVLVRYLNYFHDGHLFLSERPKLTDQQVAQRTTTAEMLPWNEQKLRAYLQKNVRRLDLIEGIWYSDEYRIGIVRDRKPGRRDFVAVMLSDGVKNWKPGQVKAEIRKLPSGEYKGLFYYADHSTHHLDGRIYKGLLLRLPPVMWGKEYPVRSFDRGLLDAKNPRSPTFKLLAGGAAVISMPSHSPEYADQLRALIATHNSELRTAPLIISDIRGNEGGSSLTSQPLQTFYYGDVQRPEIGPGGHPVGLSSPDQIKYFEAMARESDPQSEWGKTLKSLVERLKQNPGKVIPMSQKGDPYTPPERPAGLSAQPKHFAILMNRGDVSAAEAFVLEARRYQRVTLFGENTGGTIDYQNVQMVPLDCELDSFWLGFPTIGSSEFLPRGGFNGVGIAPDVRIGRDVADQLQFIVALYSKPGKN